MKHICLIIPSLRHGGAERVISVLANEWSQSPDTKVSLVLLTKQEQFYKIDPRVEVIEPQKEYSRNFLSKLFYTFWTLSFIRNTIQTVKPDTVLSFCERYNNLVLLALLGTGNHVFVSDRNNPGKNLGTLHEFLRKKLYAKAKGIIAQTDTANEILFRKTQNKNIKTIPNPLREIEDHSIQTKENIILNVGRFENQKNQKELIKIFSQLKNTENWKLMIIGIGSLKQDLQNQANDLGLSEKVELIDFQKNIDYYFQKSKIFAFTSINEGFPNALSEAMANGLAVISYDCPTGPAELIQNAENGYLIRLNDQKDYTEKLQSLIDDNILRDQLGKKATEQKQKLSTQNISNEYLKFILK